MTTRRFAFLLGLFFVLAGIAGFLPLFAHPEAGVTLPANGVAAAEYGHAILGTGDDMLFGLFPVNVAHNVVHILFGLWGLAASRSRRAALLYARSVAIIYFLLAVAGLLPALQTGFGLIPLYAKGVWLHGLIALGGLYFGWASHDEERP
ncbi:MAG TPA: DUF4383 domain-containing protein [Allosphingosinicella sp.]|nr:DUF4383 domain-containing protein [Allosphingosinicella sp.]